MPDPRALLTGQDPSASGTPSYPRALLSATPPTAPYTTPLDGDEAAEPDFRAVNLPPTAEQRAAALVPPTQASQPPFALGHTPAVNPQTAWQGAQTIGPSRVGERYLPASISQMMASDHPIQDFIGHVMGGIRPTSVASQDPYGIGAWEKGAGQMPAMAASMEPIESPGLYSRVDQVAASLPEKGVHPNKLKSLLQSGASQEEVQYRKVDDFLMNRFLEKGQQPVTRAELQAHLPANPAPFPQTTVLGETVSRRADQARLNDLARLGDDRTYPEEVEYNTLSNRLLHQQNYGGAPKYASYTLPGGESYREHLYTLPDQSPNPYSAYIEQMNRKYGEGYSSEQLTPDEQAMQQSLWERSQATAGGMTESQYRGGHFDQPNILTHVRTTERTLPVQGMRSVAEIEPIIQQAVGAKSPTSLASGAPDRAVQLGLITPDEAQLYSAHRGFNNGPGGLASSAPTGPRGRFLEEVQSDWHQAGKRSGYQQPADPAAIAALEPQVAEARAAWDQAYSDQQFAHNHAIDTRTRHTRANTPPGWAHLQNFNDAIHEGSDAIDVWRTAREQAYRHPEVIQTQEAEKAADAVLAQRLAPMQDLQSQLERLKNPKGVPNAPFKDSWPDLALKQQLLDVARDPHANWLGFTGGKTQAARYDLSKQVSRIHFEPEEAGDYSLGSLVAHDLNGDEVMRETLQPHEFDDHIGKEPADALRREIANKQHDLDQWSVAQDPETGYWHVVDPNGEYVGGDHSVTEQGAERALQRIRSGEYYSDVGRDHPEISGLDLQVGGEGMKHFYDKLLPARLQKLLKPFGGTVEPFQLPTGRPQLRAEQPGDASWIAHLSPAMKAAILKKGFPLLTLPLAVGAASLASRPATPGEPPPQPPVPAPDRR